MKHPIEIKLHVADYLDKAFKILPSNANINKGRTGSGGTTIEIETDRPSIIVVPTKGTITCKCDKHSNLFAVKGKVTVKHIQDYLLSDVPNKKFMTTPDSFEKIINAALGLGMLDQLYEQYFLLLDESHAAITDSFREKMLIPFKYFWKFKNKSMISATPLEYSNPRFKTLTDYNVTFHEEYIYNITVIPTNNIEACVDYYIRNSNLYSGKLFFFYNSVTEIAEAIRRNNLTDGHIYCADKEDNFEKLPENLLAFQQQPITGYYAKINFFTSKFFEGVDIYEPDARVFLVTDVHRAHTKVGISNKGVQAIGRLRNKPAQIIHITNHRNKSEMKTVNEFRAEYDIHTSGLINYYNTNAGLCNDSGITPLESLTKVVERYADIDEDTYTATLNMEKVDQVVYELTCDQEFNNLEGITNAWERSLYKVTVEPFAAALTTKRRKSKADQLKEFVEMMEDLNTNSDKYFIGTASKQLAKLQSENPFGYEAYHVLKKAKLEELDYNIKAVGEALINQHNANVERQLLAYLDSKLNIGDRKTPEELSNILQHGYNLFQIRNPKTGKVKVAFATHLMEPGRYQLDESKDIINGFSKKVFIIRHQYCRRSALKDVA